MEIVRLQSPVLLKFTIAEWKKTCITFGDFIYGEIDNFSKKKKLLKNILIFTLRDLIHRYYLE